MLLIPDTNILIKKPEDVNDLPVSIKNYLYANMEKGLVFFIIPPDFGLIEDRNAVLKKHIKNYKIGFIYDVLTILYPSKGKEQKYDIISDCFHLFITYRQFKSLYDEYNSSRKKYLEKRVSFRFNK